MRTSRANIKPTNIVPALVAAAAIITLLPPAPAHAHFLWLTAEREDGKPAVRAFLSETPVPEGPSFLRYIERATVTEGGKPLSWTKEEDVYRVNVPGPSPSLIDGVCDLGVMTRNGESFRLLYTARAQFGPAPGGNQELVDLLRLRIVSEHGQTPYVLVSFRGKPVAGAVVKALPDKGEPVELKSDSRGRLEYPPAIEGKAGLLAKWVEKAPGRLNEKPFSETRHYATLTFEPGTPAAASASVSASTAAAAAAAPAPYAALPRAADSLGVAVLGHWLYVYGGHTGKIHVYDNSTASRSFRRLDLRDRRTWEELPCDLALQGVTLVSHGRYVYRIGGMYPRNAPGAPSDLVSVADFARYSPEARTWTKLPPLPTPRSTHDSVVVGDKIYVVGGWSMNGGDASNSDFLDAALVFDLAHPQSGWKELPSPGFNRRALAVGSASGKVYVLGGLTEAGEVVNTVDVYDPATGAWSRGPDLPGGKRQGFAPSAFGVGGTLYASGADGELLQLNAAANRWDVVGRLRQPRLAHRLVPGVENDLLAVGGSAKGRPIEAIESLPLNLPVTGSLRASK